MSNDEIKLYDQIVLEVIRKFENVSNDEIANKSYFLAKKVIEYRRALQASFVEEKK